MRKMTGKQLEKWLEKHRWLVTFLMFLALGLAIGLDDVVVKIFN